jgi:hypothetical protein
MVLQKHGELLYWGSGRRGGIGRRDRLKIYWPKGRGGSTPSAGTMETRKLRGGALKDFGALDFRGTAHPEPIPFDCGAELHKIAKVHRLG